MSYYTYHLFFRNLANPLKIMIITELKKGDKSVSQLVKSSEMGQSNISHALSSLKCCNIVTSKIKGKERIYSLNKKTILPMLKMIDKHEKEFCKECRFRIK